MRALVGALLLGTAFAVLALREEPAREREAPTVREEQRGGIPKDRPSVVAAPEEETPGGFSSLPAHPAPEPTFEELLLAEIELQGAEDEAGLWFDAEAEILSDTARYAPTRENLVQRLKDLQLEAHLLDLDLDRILESIELQEWLYADAAANAVQGLFLDTEETNETLLRLREELSQVQREAFRRVLLVDRQHGPVALEDYLATMFSEESE